MPAPIMTNGRIYDWEYINPAWKAFILGFSVNDVTCTMPTW